MAWIYHVIITWLFTGWWLVSLPQLIPNGFLSLLGMEFKWRSSITRLKPLITNHFRPSRDMIMTSSRDKFSSNSSFKLHFYNIRKTYSVSSVSFQLRSKIFGPKSSVQNLQLIVFGSKTIDPDPWSEISGPKISIPKISGPKISGPKIFGPKIFGPNSKV